MKKLFTSTLKAAVIAAGLFGFTATAQAQTTFNVGEAVTSFVANEDYGIMFAPLLSTDTELNNWASVNTGDQNRINGKWDPRAWYAVFEINAPAAGNTAWNCRCAALQTTGRWPSLPAPRSTLPSA